MKLNNVIITCLLAGFLFIGQPNPQTGPAEISIPSSIEQHPKLDSALSLMVSHADQAYPESEDQVQITLEFSAPVDSNEPILNIVNKVGGQVQTYAGSQVQALVPVSELPDLAALPSITNIHIPNRPYPDAVSEGVVAINADYYRLNHGTDGTGVKIAILDQGFAGYPALQAVGELPAVVTAQSFRADGEVDGITPHGTACAEIIYDIAPGAAYYFVTYDTDTEFVDAVDYLEAEGIHIVSHSLSFFNLGPYDGTSAVSARITLARDNGIFWVNSAGDYSHRHWEGMYYGDDTNIHHVWDGNSATVNSIGLLENGEYIEVYLSWNDWPTSNNNYDLFLMFDDGDGWDWIKYSSTVQSGIEPPVEMITYTAAPDIEYGYLIYNDQGAAEPCYLELFSPTHDLSFYTSSSSIPHTGDAVGAFSVGAVSVTDYAASGLRAYSSQGPTNSTGGGAPDYVNGSRIKPDIAAPDGVSTETESLFQGTSASAPHAAGAAALYASGYLASFGVLPNPDQIQEYLEYCADKTFDWGTDIDGEKNNEFGAGGLFMCEIPTVIELQRFSTNNLISPSVSIILAILVTSFAGVSLSLISNRIKRTLDHR